MTEHWSVAFERTGMPLLASAVHQSHRVLRRIYSTPEIEKTLVSAVNKAVGSDILNSADCGGDLGMVVVIVIIAAPKMPDPGDMLGRQEFSQM